MDFPVNIISASAFGSFGDIYRFEDGSGDARGPLLLGRSSYCGFRRVQGQGLDQNETEEGGVGGHRDVSRRHSVTTMATATTMAASSTMILSSRSSRLGIAEMNRNVVQPSMDIGEQRQQQYHRQQTGISMSFSMLLARSLTEEPTRMNPNILPSVDGVPFIMLGQERFELEPEAIFVLGMRLSVTKNAILMFFSSVGMFAVDHASKPRIFVYKNKQNGRSKAYLSTRKGRGIRFRYPREFAPSNNREHQQDRQQLNRQRRPRK
ncbi:uncharacterized protein Dwil_GK22179 [Drosophila willistoni]|uniref:Uncharacterized protein n=1 Tax=Drosophila willistoni TaxID=7260 RepID=B4MIG3_DROWI|nr:uncharacterized protein Dwil_GK22179 [Drosophila willistoni]